MRTSTYSENLVIKILKLSEEWFLSDKTAGFPDSVLVRAASKSMEFEAQYGTGKMIKDEIAAVKDVLHITDPGKCHGDGAAALCVSTLCELQQRIEILFGR